MIKYMVIAYAHNHLDEWVEIKHSDIGDIKDAERFRDILLQTSRIDPANVHVVMYKE